MKKIWLDGLCSRLDEETVNRLEPENTTGLRPDPERIKALVLDKLRQQEQNTTGGERVDLPPPLPESRNQMKKKSLHMLIAAAVVCLLSVTALALGGADFFRAIFGDSAQSIESQIETPMVTEENGEYRLSAVASLSDGYKTDLILSVESLKKDGSQKNIQEKLTGAVDGGWDSRDCTPLEEFDTPDRSYYRMETATLESHAGRSLTVTLDLGSEPLSLTVGPSLRTPTLSVEIPADAFEDKNYRPEQIQLSPLGILIIGSENEAKGGLPIANVYAVMENGKREEIMPTWAFDQGSEDEAPAMGGGGVAIGEGRNQPLVIQTMGVRNPDGKVVTTGYFSRILPLAKVKSLEIDGQQFPVD